MSVLGDIASAVGGAATGGIIGTVGSLGTLAATYFVDKQKSKDARLDKQQDHDHELKMAQLTSNAARDQADRDLKLKELEGRITEIASSYSLIGATVADQTALSNRASQWVVDVLSLVRPGLTVLLILMAVLFGVLSNPNGFYQSTLMASMAVAWWFGDRQQGQNRTVFTPIAKAGVK